MDVNAPKFRGPATAAAISEWFTKCEAAFRRYENLKPGTLVDSEKIAIAGGVIADDEEMLDETCKGLLSWYNWNATVLENDTWDTFRDEVKDQLLGTTWRLTVLKQFFTYCQDDIIEAYFKQFWDLRNSMRRSSQLPNVDEQVYNCLLLFRTSPEIYEPFLEDLISAEKLFTMKELELRRMLKKYETPTAKVPPLHYSQLTAADIPYLLGKLWGNNGPNYGFQGGYETGGTDPLGSYPDHPRELGRLTRLDIWGDTNQGIVQRFGLTFSNYSSILYQGSGNHNSHKFTLDLDKDDYIQSATFSRYIYYGRVSYVHVKTAKGKEVEFGTRRDENKTFTAPRGYCIVGFQFLWGRYHTLNRVNWYTNRKVGAIYGPILQ